VRTPRANPASRSARPACTKHSHWSAGHAICGSTLYHRLEKKAREPSTEHCHLKTLKSPPGCVGRNIIVGSPQLWGGDKECGRGLARRSSAPMLPLRCGALQFLENSAKKLRKLRCPRTFYCTSTEFELSQNPIWLSQLQPPCKRLYAYLWPGRP
jgi:hypothetical protein